MTDEQLETICLAFPHFNYEQYEYLRVNYWLLKRLHYLAYRAIFRSLAFGSVVPDSLLRPARAPTAQVSFPYGQLLARGRAPQPKPGGGRGRWQQIPTWGDVLVEASDAGDSPPTEAVSTRSAGIETASERPQCPLGTGEGRAPTPAGRPAEGDPATPRAPRVAKRPIIKTGFFRGFEDAREPSRVDGDALS